MLSEGLTAQELYVSTEPASNMPKNSIGLRLTSEVMPGSDLGFRLVPEVMVGITKNLMGHAILYISDIHQKKQKVEGFGVYGKYRFLSIDSLQRHFRMAAYGRYSSINNPTYTLTDFSPNSSSYSFQAIDEINLEGDNSGVQGGLVATQLIHKLALSASVNYNRAFNNRGGNELLAGQATEALGYTFSTGYLTYPKVYTSYEQPNINVYMEFLGKTNLVDSKSFLEAAPALQVILNSRTRIDVSKRIEIYGNMARMTKNMWLFRIEHNLFNVF
ncbi:hypothetical protein SAMN05661099_2588 [Daejeonella lutea]|uniref:MetA-pathway of phenol degradation n=2 Tax=Daejeonella lutea TaxID=572036 RepID=A0A1T5DT72_9SPHI|nr:hypothetical protein SAMN05661099_2588 [Daejeonella lutea]